MVNSQNRTAPFKGLCQHTALSFFNLFKIRSEHLRLPGKKSAASSAFFPSTELVLFDSSELQVENLSTFQKGAGDVTIALFQATKHLLD